MKVIVAGGTGFLGQSLCSTLAKAGHTVVVLTRGNARPKAAWRSVLWEPDGAVGKWAADLDGADAVVNLAGEGLANRRWTAERKAELQASRVLATRSLVSAIRSATYRPKTFVSGSAVGFYGATGDQTLDESFPPGDDFLAQLCVRWEAEAHAVSALGPRLVILRTGVVLARDGGVLKRLTLPFRFFVGGPIASGRQYISWIHLDDWLALVRWALESPDVAGTINATAPTPVRNAEFCQAFGRALHRPSWLRMPGFALSALFGEVADVTLVRGQCVVPARAMAFRFPFKYSRLDAAMAAAMHRDELDEGLPP